MDANTDTISAARDPVRTDAELALELRELLNAAAQIANELAQREYRVSIQLHCEDGCGHSSHVVIHKSIYL